jgi:cbb3-type cytochrome oxidase subunit 1
MTISGNHNVIGAHAHTNLLGWVTSALFGTYYACDKEKAAQRLAMIQFGVYTLGVVVMVPSLYLLLQGNSAAEPFVAASSLIAFLGVILFAFIVFSPARIGAMPPAPLAAG